MSETTLLWTTVLLHWVVEDQPRVNDYSDWTDCYGIEISHFTMNYRHFSAFRRNSRKFQSWRKKKNSNRKYSNDHSERNIQSTARVQMSQMCNKNMGQFSCFFFCRFFLGFFLYFLKKKFSLIFFDFFEKFSVFFFRIFPLPKSDETANRWSNKWINWYFVPFFRFCRVFNTRNPPSATITAAAKNIHTFLGKLKKFILSKTYQI